MNTRAEVDAWFERVPEHVVTVVDQAYFEYIDDPDYSDAVEEHFKPGRNVVVAAHVLEDLRARRAARRLRGRRRRAVVTELSKVRRAFDVSTPAQEAALASLGDAARARVGGAS